MIFWILYYVMNQGTQLGNSFWEYRAALPTNHKRIRKQCRVPQRNYSICVNDLQSIEEEHCSTGVQAKAWTPLFTTCSGLLYPESARI